MKNTPNAYERHLSTYLSNNNYPEAEDLSFITARAEQAYDVFCEARLGGVDVSTAEELALITLMQGYNVELNDVVKNILDTDLADHVPEYEYDVLIADMDDLLEEYKELDYEAYSDMLLNGNDPMRLELIGLISDYLEYNGL